MNPTRRVTPVLALLLVSLAAPPFTHAKSYRVTVAAADVARAGQVVAFPLPADAPKSPTLRDVDGRSLALQLEADGTARFIVPAQKPGEVLAFNLSAGTGTPRQGVTVEPDHGDLRVSVGGQPVFFYRMDKNAVPREDIPAHIRRAGYLYSVFSPTGKLVTDDYPSNHVHHHGMWTPWTKTKFQGRTVDFWNMQGKTGAGEFVALDRTWAGPLAGGFEGRHRQVDLTAKPEPVVALNETWQVTAYDVPVAATAVRMFDLVVTQTCATNDPVEPAENLYGGFGFRGAAGWNGPGDAARFLTSEGETDRRKGNNTRARWCYLGGPVDGALVAGTAVLGHPDNFRAPQPVRLHPDMPYFSFAPQQLGAFAIEPGKPYVARFRFIVTDGPPDRAQLDAYWQGYATHAVVKLDPL